MPASSETLTLLIPDTAHGVRLDRWLADQLPERSRSEIQRWIGDNLVLVDGLPGKSALRLTRDQKVVVTLPGPTKAVEILPEDIDLAILFEDNDIVVVNKPAGMVVHPAPGHSGGTLVNAILYHCPQIEGVGGERRPGIVHRLDKETSGAIVVAKNDRAHRDLQAQFKARTVEKIYLALLEGRIEPPRGRISAPIGRHPVDRKRQAILTPDPVSGESRGREAQTEYETIANYSHIVPGSNARANFSLVRVNLLTGRTHQIRVHFAWLKYPVAGDTLYGYRKQRLNLKRQFLHAESLALRLPASGERMVFTAPLAPELEETLRLLAPPA